MKRYCLYLTTNGAISSSAVVRDFADDAVAFLTAMEQVTDMDGCEVWDGDRLVFGLGPRQPGNMRCPSRSRQGLAAGPVSRLDVFR